MIPDTQHTRPVKRPSKSKRVERLSPDGKWLSFPQVPNLLQYVSTGLYFARVKVNGKLIRRGLNAKTFEEAKLALHDFLAKETKRRHVTGAPTTIGEAIGQYRSTTDNDTVLADASKHYREMCLDKLTESLPGIEAMKPRALTRFRCEEWACTLSKEVSAQYFNNILGTFKAILKLCGIDDDQHSPLANVKRLGVKLAPPTLPEPDQFISILHLMETSGAGKQQEVADFARFLAFSGARLSEARAATWADVDLAKGLLTIHNAKTRAADNRSETRLVPIIPDMRTLLERLRKDDPAPTAPICAVGECEKSLARACKLAGVPRLTHHDLRHLFATRCIEAGVDIPTVSRWLGHADGGALAMRVYGHLREKHSAEMAAKVTFSAPVPENVIPMEKEASV